MTLQLFPWTSTRSLTRCLPGQKSKQSLPSSACRKMVPGKSAFLFASSFHLENNELAPTSLAVFIRKENSPRHHLPDGIRSSLSGRGRNLGSQCHMDCKSN